MHSTCSVHRNGWWTHSKTYQTLLRCIKNTCFAQCETTEQMGGDRDGATDAKRHCRNAVTIEQEEARWSPPHCGKYGAMTVSRLPRGLSSLRRQALSSTTSLFVRKMSSRRALVLPPVGRSDNSTKDPASYSPP